MQPPQTPQAPSSDSTNTSAVQYRCFVIIPLADESIRLYQTNHHLAFLLSTIRDTVDNEYPYVDIVGGECFLPPQTISITVSSPGRLDPVLDREAILNHASQVIAAWLEQYIRRGEIVPALRRIVDEILRMTGSRGQRGDLHR
ncbi:hypothetical protein N7539_001662 [Penicillium diatomitis]|uniref:Uncharacterized protein n=1 Tax=Penicillium diatomitis TaxID=2819901 RepID=A0A9W9XH68_9EURO|nr:uncharacterized protein N7539_001662 [Penicillium diatomitis]KAJ5492916.1 hypothetical protein N7539_001662 [Penicillium diatomitis]